MNEEMLSLVNELRDLADRMESACGGEEKEEGQESESEGSESVMGSPKKPASGNKVGAALLALKKNMAK